MVYVTVHQTIWIAYHEIDLLGIHSRSTGNLQLDAGVTYDCHQLTDEYLEFPMLSGRVALRAASLKPLVISGAVTLSL